ncbi:hypothetical protein P280DRAFT_530389 [Massarina eburnea CBS 473.64]|uniref:Uncharacterized protein n=1 Tax=Massarina eburnea CBS 473.64 TaxID=1395130 RepID=A0A6A6RRT6_9PLEO|nr:hypothetical protein P280DRAFT_530389 [Massarina eburnea CBS 473.64]
MEESRVHYQNRSFRNNMVFVSGILACILPDSWCKNRVHAKHFFNASANIG